MVTHNEAAGLMGLISGLAYVRERCRSASTITPVQPIQHLRIFTVLIDCYYILDWFAKNHYPNLRKVAEDIKSWIEHLDNNYVEQYLRSNIENIVLSDVDAKNLSALSQQWISYIIKEFKAQGTVLIKEEDIAQIIEYSNKSDIVNALAKQDLDDALRSILSSLPTQAAMISLRVAESIAREYYKKITGNDPTNKGWKKILDELKESKKVKNSILGYLDCLRHIRNKAQHPVKRFTQEESERLLLKIKDLLEELSKY
jgi:ribosomal protein S17E